MSTLHTTIPRLPLPYGGDIPNVEVWISHYADGNIAVQLRDDEGPYATVSVNLPESLALPDGWFYAKTWSENEGLVEALISAGVLESDPTRTARAGWSTALACRLR